MWSCSQMTSGGGGVVVKLECGVVVSGQRRCECGTSLGNAGKGTLPGGVIELPGSRPLGEAMSTAGMEGGSLLHDPQCAEGV